MAPAFLGALFSVGVASADSDELICRAKLRQLGRATTSDSPSNTRNLAALSKKPLLDLEFE
uniref:Uncharacterized protein n=1 Tax=Brassica campestris TaxID=3711 RepID=A0A3P5YIC7_BRACM|nr:unnamed protein product [Brassica rapa]